MRGFPMRREKEESKLYGFSPYGNLAAPYDHSTRALLNAGPGASRAQGIAESIRNALVDFRTRKNTDTGNKHYVCTPQPTRWHTHVVQSPSLTLPPRHRVGPEAASV